MEERSVLLRKKKKKRKEYSWATSKRCKALQLFLSLNAREYKTLETIKLHQDLVSSWSGMQGKSTAKVMP